MSTKDIKRRKFMTLLPSKTAVTKWNSRTSGKLSISKQEFYRNANLFLNANPHIQTQVLHSLNGQLRNLEFKTYINNGKTYKRISAGSLNSAIKKKLKTKISGLKFEVEFEEGVFYDSPRIKGFDFALFDDTFNIINFRNYCFGRRAIYEGDIRWERELELPHRKNWKKIAKKESLPNVLYRGIDLPNHKNSPTIIGEIQFGNWALLHYDILKAINIEQFMDIDVLIYITATGNLSKYISDGTVNFEKSKKDIEENKNIINVPIWLIGIDFS